MDAIKSDVRCVKSVFYAHANRNGVLGSHCRTVLADTFSDEGKSLATPGVVTPRMLGVELLSVCGDEGSTKERVAQ